MTGKIYHVGYEMAGAAQFVEDRMKQPQMLMIDTRLTPYSWRVEWQKASLQKQYGKRYRWAGDYIGNLDHNINAIRLKHPGPGIARIVQLLQQGHDCLLICKCADEACHRYEVLRLLQAAMPAVEIVGYTNGVEPVQQVEQPTLL